jgi:transcription elongation factor Elf1
MAREDLTKGYRAGDKCPKCGGLIEIRPLVKPGNQGDYAQCGKCPWNSMR